jgi:hypothetical protein
MMIGSSDETVRVDLHLHSRASGSATYVWVKGLGDDGDVRESYTLAHPMYSVTKPLDKVAVEKRLVLFGLWEFVNGSRPASQNRLAREAAENVGALDLRQMALRHGLGAPVVEAQASGLPAVVYDIGGPLENVSGRARPALPSPSAMKRSSSRSSSCSLTTRPCDGAWDAPLESSPQR